jgi:hypothetical protein
MLVLAKLVNHFYVRTRAFGWSAFIRRGLRICAKVPDGGSRQHRKNIRALIFAAAGGRILPTRPHFENIETRSETRPDRPG